MSILMYDEPMYIVNKNDGHQRSGLTDRRLFVVTREIIFLSV